MSEGLDLIRLTGLSAVGNHGVFDFERRSGQVFTVDLVIYLDVSKAAVTDDVVDTAHYGEIAEDVVKIIEGEPVSLIETLADEVARRVLTYPHVVKVEVTVHKPAAPVHHHFTDVAVTVSRTHADYSEDLPELGLPEVGLFDRRLADEARGALSPGAIVHPAVVEPVILDDDWPGKPVDFMPPSPRHAPSGPAPADPAPPEYVLPEPVSPRHAPPKHEPPESFLTEPRLPTEPTRATRQPEQKASMLPAEHPGVAPYPLRSARHNKSRLKQPEEHVTPSHEYRVVLALGSNKGDILGNLRGAVDALAANPRFAVSGVSPLVRSKAVLLPGSLPQPDYYNAVVLGRTDMTPPVLLEAVQQIEQKFGRSRPSKWAARTLDIDIVAIDDMQFKTRSLTVPHALAHTRAFVLFPWSLLDEDAHIPGVGSVSGCLKDAEDRAGIRAVRFSWLNEDEESAEQSITLAGRSGVEVLPVPVEEEVVIRGFNIGLNQAEEDPLFRSLLKKERTLCSSSVARQRPRRASTAKTVVRPSRSDVDVALPATVEVPSLGFSLPAWDFVGGQIRIVETSGDETDSAGGATVGQQAGARSSRRPTASSRAAGVYDDQAGI